MFRLDLVILRLILTIVLPDTVHFIVYYCIRATCFVSYRIIVRPF